MQIRDSRFSLYIFYMIIAEVLRSQMMPVPFLENEDEWGGADWADEEEPREDD